MTLTKKQATALAILFALAGGLLAVWRLSPAIMALFGPEAGRIAEYLPDDSVPPGAVVETSMPLRIPPGFRISLFAKNLPGARVMRFDAFGNLWVSRTSAGAVTLLEVNQETGEAVRQSDVFRGLQKPHGLAFDPALSTLLYIAEEHRIRRMAAYSEDAGEDVLDLPAEGGGHFTRTIAFGPDKKLYISVGSSCNVCREEDGQRAAMLRWDPMTRQFEIFARGLRNAVFFTWSSAQKLWASEMGRDWLGDELPPDEINIVEQGGDYGWPICYGRNIHDSDFDKNVYIRDPCADKKPSAIDLPAHSAPLGLAFIPEEGWPEEYRGDLLVAYHGSWNRSQPTGYKVVRHRFDAGGNYQGAEDFITGWLTPEGALGRPVDIAIRPDGSMFLSDDKAGVIYKIVWQGS